MPRYEQVLHSRDLVCQDQLGFALNADVLIIREAANGNPSRCSLGSKHSS
jgi:hypothetical protein